MRYKVTHRTTSTYEGPVTVGHYVARLTPRTLPFHHCPWHELVIRPQPVIQVQRSDAFGNLTSYFEIEGSHLELEVTSRCLIEVTPAPAGDPAASPAWETVREAARSERFGPASLAGEFLFASALIPLSPDYAAYALPSFPPGKPVLAGLIDLTERMFRDFKFDPAATDVATPVSKVFQLRRGVCQDFAQVMIACVRSLGLPARYVSGYLETLPPPGKPKLVGADASHAWVSVYCGEEFGWVDADPTNGILPTTRHLTLAWGRDFRDVSPLRGVTLGAGEHRLAVAVDVTPDSD